ncbi:MAG: hypothetical protein LBQ47_09045 [Endomicrobium sp.]|nr:hypothetical protein [Endomicrobium sp.]
MVKNAIIDEMKSLFCLKNIIAAVIVSVAVFAVYFGNFSNGFTPFDDRDEIVTNPLVNPQINSFKDILLDFQTFHFYVPLKNAVNLWLNKISFLDPRLQHLVSDFLHLLNVLLCFVLVLKLSKSFRISFLTALFFAVSPACSNSINEISARGHLFTAFFGQISVLFYIFADENREKFLKRTLFRILSAAVFFAGLFFWVTLAVLPLFIFVYECLKKERIAIKQLFFRLLLPFFMASAICVSINVFIAPMAKMQSTQNFTVIDSNDPNAGAVIGNGLEPFYKIWGASLLYKVPVTVSKYITLCFVYPFFDAAIEMPGGNFLANLICAVPLCIFIALSFLIWRKDRQLIFGSALFFIFLIPGIFFIYPTQAPILRYLYFPAAGAAYTVFAFLELYVFCKIGGGYKKWAVIFIISLWFVYMGVNSYTRKYLWENPATVINAMIENGGYASCWGWFLKGELSFGNKNKLICFLKSQEELLKVSPKKVANYEIVKQNLEEVIKNLVSDLDNEQKVLSPKKPAKRVENENYNHI